MSCAGVLAFVDQIVTALERTVNIVTDLASGIAIYLFIAKREQISTAVRLLLNYAFQAALHELNQKLDRLNEQNAEA